MDIILYRTFFTFYIINLADIQKSGMEFRESILIVSFFKRFQMEQWSEVTFEVLYLSCNYLYRHILPIIFLK